MIQPQKLIKGNEVVVDIQAGIPYNYGGFDFIVISEDLDNRLVSIGINPLDGTWAEIRALKEIEEGMADFEHLLVAQHNNDFMIIAIEINASNDYTAHILYGEGNVLEIFVTGPLLIGFLGGILISVGGFIIYKLIKKVAKRK